MFVKMRLPFGRLGVPVLFICLWSGTRSSCFAQTENETSDLSVASVRKALAREHAAISTHPKDPANYIDLAYTLTDAGLGDEARLAAADATRISPTSSLAFSAQGWVLHHNSIGVDYGSGFDYDGALRSLQRAVELDPKDLDVRESLGNLLEFDRQGVRYSPDAQLSLAIDAYRYVQQHQRPLKEDVVDNLAINLYYAGRYEDAIKEVEGLPGTDKHLGVLLASIAASKGSKVAIAASDRIEGDEQRRKDALTFAAEGLWNRRLYAQAADLLTASLPDTKEGTGLSAKIQLFRDLKPFSPANLPGSDPRRPVQRLVELAFTGTLDEASMKELISRHSYDTDAAWTAALHQSNALAGILLALMKQTGLPRSVVADIILGRMNVTASSDSKLGSPVRVQVIGIAPLSFFVVSEEGEWKVAANGRSAKEVGSQALYLLAKDNTATAKSLLDWYYSLLDSSRAAGDPLSGNLFLRLWAPKYRTSTGASSFAAAALVNNPTLLKPLVPEIVRARDESPAGDRRTDLDVLLATLFLGLGDVPNAHAVTSRLLEEYPESTTALHMAGQSFELEHNWTAWKALVTERLRREPDSRELLVEDAVEAEAESDYGRARQAYKRILDGAHSTPNDYTMYAWLSLFAGKPDEAAVAAAQQATLDSNGRNYQSLLTLACLNAVQGKTAEAHQQLLDAMSSAHLDQPDAGIWYGFGQIFEQYGAADAAASAYRRTVQMSNTEGPKNLVPGGGSAAILARVRLKELTTK